MGSKNRSYKNPNFLFSPPPVGPLADGNPRNPENPNLASPSKSSKTQKHSSTMFKVPGLRLPTSSDDRQSHSRKSKIKRKEVSISPSAASAGVDGSASHSSLLRWGEEDNLKLIKAVYDYREKNGFLPTLSYIPDFLKEVKVWAPGLISEKQLHNKLRHFRFKFQRSLKPGPESSEFDRIFHEFASKVWGSDSSKANGSSSGALKDDGKRKRKVKTLKLLQKSKSEKKEVEGDKEEGDSDKEDSQNEEDEGTDEPAEKIMESEKKSMECENDKVFTDVYGDLLEGTDAEFPYKYLRHALEEFWAEKKLDMDTLNSAFPKVDPVQAKILDEQFKEIYEEEIKLELEKNKLAIEIINAALGR